MIRVRIDVGDGRLAARLAAALEAAGFAVVRGGADLLLMESAAGAIVVGGLSGSAGANEGRAREHYGGADDEALDGGRADERALTPRELEVLALLAEGASNKEIARRLAISPSTAKFHVSSIIDKLDAVGRTDALALAAKKGVIEL